jgi:hypothetical protein
MITRNDWLAAADAFRDEERARLGGPPTDQERAAYARGELSGAEMERVRALIVYYDDGLLSDEEKAEDWAAIEAAIATQPKDEPSSLRWLLPLAAALVVAFLAGRYSDAPHPEPRLHSGRLILEPQLTRGSTPEIADLPPEAKSIMLELRLGTETAFPRCRVDVVSIESTPPRTVWSNEVALASENALELSLPRGFLAPGLYRIDVAGVNGSKAEPLERYIVRVHPGS